MICNAKGFIPVRDITNSYKIVCRTSQYPWDWNFIESYHDLISSYKLIISDCLDEILTWKFLEIMKKYAAFWWMGFLKSFFLKSLSDVTSILPSLNIVYQ